MASPTAQKIMNKEHKRAVWLQLFIHDHFGVDVASYTQAELFDLAKKLMEFVALGVDSDQLQEAENYSTKEAVAAGYKA